MIVFIAVFFCFIISDITVSVAVVVVMSVLPSRAIVPSTHCLDNQKRGSADASKRVIASVGTNHL